MPDGAVVVSHGPQVVVFSSNDLDALAAAMDVLHGAGIYADGDGAFGGMVWVHELDAPRARELLRADPRSRAGTVSADQYEKWRKTRGAALLLLSGCDGPNASATSPSEFHGDYLVRSILHLVVRENGEYGVLIPEGVAVEGGQTVDLTTEYTYGTWSLEGDVLVLRKTSHGILKPRGPVPRMEEAPIHEEIVHAILDENGERLLVGPRRAHERWHAEGRPGTLAEWIRKAPRETWRRASRSPGPKRSRLRSD
jgi:hypothetical protein